MNYYQTLITVADDCPVTSSVVPEPRGGRKTVAVLQYELLAGRPYRLTQEDVLFLSWLPRQPGTGDLSEPRVAALRDRFLAKPQACLRASPLPKKYGFGLLFNADGLITLCPVESPEYRHIIEGGTDVDILKALRSRR